MNPESCTAALCTDGEHLLLRVGAVRWGAWQSPCMGPTDAATHAHTLLEWALGAVADSDIPACTLVFRGEPGQTTLSARRVRHGAPGAQCPVMLSASDDGALGSVTAGALATALFAALMDAPDGTHARRVAQSASIAQAGLFAAPWQPAPARRGGPTHIERTLAQGAAPPPRALAVDPDGARVLVAHTQALFTHGMHNRAAPGTPPTLYTSLHDWQARVMWPDAQRLAYALRAEPWTAAL